MRLNREAYQMLWWPKGKKSHQLRRMVAVSATWHLALVLKIRQLLDGWRWGQKEIMPG